jgi:hypothetical protein
MKDANDSAGRRPPADLIDNLAGRAFAVDR